MAVLGALAAVMAMVREQDAFFVAGPAIDFAWSLARRRDGQAPIATARRRRRWARHLRR